MSMDEIVNYIILLGAVVGALKEIILPLISSSKFFKKEIKSKKQLAIEKSIKKSFDEMDPKIKSISDKLEDVDYRVKVIEKQNKIQDLKLSEVEKDMKGIAQGTRDSLRAEMLKIYYKYLPYSMIPSFDRQAFMEMYISYTELGGNTFIHDIKPILESWKVVEKQSDIPNFKH